MNHSGCLLAGQLISSCEIADKAKIKFFSEYVNLKLTLLDLIELYHHTYISKSQYIMYIIKLKFELNHWYLIIFLYFIEKPINILAES